jgi:hypothetical protein
MADIIKEVGFRSDFVGVLHVLKRAELVEDVDSDAEVVDEGISIIGAEQGHPITGQAIGGGCFFVVEQSACVQILYQVGNVMYDIIHDNVHDIGIQTSIS